MTDLEKSMSLEVSARKVTERKKHGEKSVQKLEKSVKLPSGSRSYKIFGPLFGLLINIILININVNINIWGSDFKHILSIF